MPRSDDKRRIGPCSLLDGQGVREGKKREGVAREGRVKQRGGEEGGGRPLQGHDRLSNDAARSRTVTTTSLYAVVLQH